MNLDYFDKKASRSRKLKYLEQNLDRTEKYRKQKLTDFRIYLQVLRNLDEKL